MTKYPSVCGICGARAVVPCSEPVEVEFRNSSHTVTGFTYERCGACGEDFFDLDQVGAIHTAASDQVRRAGGLLTPDEIKALRLSLGLTQAGFERVLGASPGSIGRWERGTFAHGPVADRLMRLIGTHPELVHEVAGGVVCEARGPYRTSKSRRSQDTD